MTRLLSPTLLALVALSGLLVTGCGTRSEPVDEEIDTEAPASNADADLPGNSEAEGNGDEDAQAGAAGADGENGNSEAGETFDLVTATLAGEHVPSEISVTIIPGIGYRIGKHRLELDTVEEILGIMAYHNRFADVQIRTAPTGRATLVTPILDACQKHGLVNVTLWDGITISAEPTPTEESTSADAESESDADADVNADAIAESNTTQE